MKFSVSTDRDTQLQVVSIILLNIIQRLETGVISEEDAKKELKQLGKQVSEKYVLY